MAQQPQPVRVIFLDIDGVICCNAYGRLEDSKLEILRSVAQKTGAKIVLSTDWRRVPQLKQQVIQTLKNYGMTTIGATPCRPNWLAVRPEEITSWLKSYHSAPNAHEKGPIHHWVAIDDRPLLQEQGGDELRGHFVRTKLAVGITDRVAQRMIEILTGQDAGDSSPGGTLLGRTNFNTTDPAPSLHTPPAARLTSTIGATPSPPMGGARSAYSSTMGGYSTPPPPDMLSGAGAGAGAGAGPGESVGHLGSYKPAGVGATRSYALGRTPPAAFSSTPAGAASVNAKRPGVVGTPQAGRPGAAGSPSSGRGVGTPPGGRSASVGRSPAHVSSAVHGQWYNTHRNAASPLGAGGGAGAYGARGGTLASSYAGGGGGMAAGSRPRYAH